MSLQLNLNINGYDLIEAGWGKTLSAQQFVVDGPLDKDLWREPLTGALMLRPAPFSAEWRESLSFEASKLDATDFHLQSPYWETILTKGGDSDPFLSTVYAAGSTTSGIEYSTGIDIAGLKTSYGDSLVWALQSKTNSELNQGLYAEVRNFGYNFEKVSNYLAIMFGQYAIRLQTDGIAILYKYKPAANSWTFLKEMRFAGQSEQHGTSLSLLILPVLGNRLHFYFSTGRAVNAAYDNQRSPGPRDSYYSYRMPIEEETWDNSAKVWRVVDQSPIRVAVAPGRRYLMQMGRVVFPTDAKSATLGHDDLGLPRSNDPSATLYGYAPGNSSVDSTILDKTTGVEFLSGTDTKPQPRVTLQAASNGIWSPEVHGVALDFPELIFAISRSQMNASVDVLRVRLRLHNELEPQEMEVYLRDPIGAYSSLRELASVPSKLALAGGIVFQGDSVRVESLDAPGPPVVRLRFRDGWERLEQLQFGPEINYDGMLHTDVIRRVLNRAGFPDGFISISDDDVQLPGGGQSTGDPNSIPLSPAANDWRFAPKPRDTPAEIARLVAKQFSGWRLRHDGGVWRYQPKPGSTTPSKYVYLTTGGYNGSGHSAADRIRAFDYRQHKFPPDFNTLYVYCADATGGEVRRVTTIEQNEPSITDSGSDDYVGRVSESHISVSWAPTLGACSRVSRLLMEESGHARRVVVFTGEWKPGFVPDTIAELFGTNNESLGIFLLEEVEIWITRDWDELYEATYVASRLVAP